MVCLVCQTDNKDGAKNCRKCGVDLAIEPMWKPSWRWHLKSLAVIYIILIIAYFSISKFLNDIPEPYRVRDIPKDVTPWLK